MTTESDDQQFVITLVTVVNSSSIPFRERDRALQVMSDEKKRKTHRGVLSQRLHIIQLFIVAVFGKKLLVPAAFYDFAS